MRRYLALPLAAAMTLAAACSSPESGDHEQGSGQAGGDVATLEQLGIKNPSAPMDHVFCSGQPTEEQFDKLEAAGITHVLHLRTKGESGTGWEEERAAKADVRFERLEIAGGKGLTRENVEAFASKLDSYGDETVLVSCGSSNRVGAMFALKAAWIDGKSKDEAMAIGKSAGMKSLSDTVDKLLSK
ncbi:MAG: hypothetical protein ACE37K_22135 [Planctomycetota bacterium]